MLRNASDWVTATIIIRVVTFPKQLITFVNILTFVHQVLCAANSYDKMMIFNLFVQECRIVELHNLKKYSYIKIKMQLDSLAYFLKLHMVKTHALLDTYLCFAPSFSHIPVLTVLYRIEAETYLR